MAPCCNTLASSPSEGGELVLCGSLQFRVETLVGGKFFKEENS